LLLLLLYRIKHPLLPLPLPALLHRQFKSKEGMPDPA
jgi:hypothetical protein